MALHSLVVSLSLSKDGMVLNYVTMVATVGMPRTISELALRTECLLAVDDAAEAAHPRMRAIDDGPCRSTDIEIRLSDVRLAQQVKALSDDTCDLRFASRRCGG